ncbi:MAG: DUF4124 domain-containing protein [Marinobacter sp.]|uniref:DUF4124 domain-containing protein n=1 Tax=Marinobacter sp. TaxID=50741 RepID=UPI00356A6050
MLMKWLIRLAFPALGVLVALVFFGINDPTSTSTEPAETEANVDIPSFEGLVPSPVPTEGPDIVFKWQDRDGSWHYADTPPPQGSWNALAIERAENKTLRPQDADPETDWQSPYRAPFSLSPDTANNGS